MCVLGGGVRGCSIAALLAESGYFDVKLLEKHSIGSGTTSVNHGRLHSGASLWRRDPGETSEQEERRAAIIRRRLRGAALIRQAMPDCFSRAKSGVHLIHPELTSAFIEACARYGIPVSRNRQDALPRRWVHPSILNWTVAGVPEYAFLPTKLTLRLALLAAASGAVILPNHAVQSVTQDGGSIRVTLADQSVHQADAVVNATSGWASTIDCEFNHYLDLPLQYSFPKITLLVVRGIRHLPPLSRAITVIEPDALLPTVIPHANAFVFHADVHVGPAGGTTRLDRNVSRLALLDFGSPFEAALFDACSRYFPPLAVRAVASQIESVGAVYPRLDHLRPSRPFRVHSMLDKSPYWVVSGGNATTTLLDACDTVDTMLRVNATISIQQ